MDKENFVFVYGSLREEMSHPLRNLFVRHGIFLGTGTFQGKLYDLGRYPGAVASNSTKDRVVGEVFRIQEPEHVLELLDKYEGRRFKRERVRVALNSDDAIVCWTYLYMRSLSGRRLIPSGDYVEYCKFLERDL
jgi:gamma-glutamylcyclotransferase (GGCT)/AIG2-like uncharacterized protein YtfP